MLSHNLSCYSLPISRCSVITILARGKIAIPRAVMRYAFSPVLSRSFKALTALIAFCKHSFSLFRFNTIFLTSVINRLSRYIVYLTNFFKRKMPVTIQFIQFSSAYHALPPLCKRFSAYIIALTNDYVKKHPIIYNMFTNDFILESKGAGGPVFGFGTNPVYTDRKSVV